MIRFIKTQIKKILYTYFKHVGYFRTKIEGYSLKLNHEDYVFWQHASKGRWEPETFKILKKFLTPSSLYLDIGAWIGPTVVYASKNCEKVICFEPDPVAYRRLLFNLRTNNINNVSPYNVAVSDQSTIIKMSPFIGDLGDSTTSLLASNDKASSGFEALVLDWNSILDIFKLQKIDMIKIDIEGGEFSLVPRMEAYIQKYKPIIWLSLHVPFLEEKDRVTELQKIIDIMSIYKICIDSDLKSIDINELKSEKHMSTFPAFLFTD